MADLVALFRIMDQLTFEERQQLLNYLRHRQAEAQAQSHSARTTEEIPATPNIPNPKKAPPDLSRFGEQNQGPCCEGDMAGYLALRRSQASIRGQRRV